MARINLSRLSEVLDKQNGCVFHIGIDVHKNSYHVAFHVNNGFCKAFVCSAEPAFLIKQIQEFGSQIAQVAY